MKTLSVLALAARQRVYKLLALILLLALAQGALFWRYVGGFGSASGLESAVRESRMPLALLAVFLLLFFLFCREGSERGGSHPGYTLARLGTGEFGAMLCAAAANAACFLVLWAAAAGVGLGLCALGARAMPADARNAQTVFLAFYRSSYLHSLLPMADWTRALRVVVLCLACGLGAASFSFWRRRRAAPVLAAFCAVGAPVCFSGEMALPVLDVCIVLVGLFACGCSIFQMYHAYPPCDSKDPELNWDAL